MIAAESDRFKSVNRLSCYLEENSLFGSRYSLFHQVGNCQENPRQAGAFPVRSRLCGD
jgi:hypothetical protein